jgi:hypothetical protein
MTAEWSMSVNYLREHRAREQVRVAYGEVPTLFEGLPVDYPLLTKIRQLASSILVAEELLTDEELRTLSLTEATRTVVQRVRA